MFLNKICNHILYDLRKLKNKSKDIKALKIFIQEAKQKISLYGIFVQSQNCMQLT